MARTKYHRSTTPRSAASEVKTLLDLAEEITGGNGASHEDEGPPQSDVMSERKKN